MKTYYLVYKIVNKINGKYYIGVHKTKNKDDGYMGSGKAILAAEQKYGIENFSKEILFECSSKEEMFQKEKELVTEDVVNDRMSYNMKLGGTANFYYINHNKLNHSKNQHLIHGNRIKNDSIYAKQFSEKMKTIYKKTKNIQHIKHIGKKWIHNPVTHENKQAKDDLLNDLLAQGWQLGLDTTNSPNFGGKQHYNKIWIYNPITKENKLINKNDSIPVGWKRGMVIQKKLNDTVARTDQASACKALL